MPSEAYELRVCGASSPTPDEIDKKCKYERTTYELHELTFLHSWSSVLPMVLAAMTAFSAPAERAVGCETAAVGFAICPALKGDEVAIVWPV